MSELPHPLPLVTKRQGAVLSNLLFVNSLRLNFYSKKSLIMGVNFDSGASTDSRPASPIPL